MGERKGERGVEVWGRWVRERGEGVGEWGRGR